MGHALSQLNHSHVLTIHSIFPSAFSCSKFLLNRFVTKIPIVLFPSPLTQYGQTRYMVTLIIVMIITNAVELSPSRHAASCAATQELPQPYKTEGLVTVLTRALHQTLSWARSVHSIPLHPIFPKSILILSAHLRFILPRDPFRTGFPTNNLCVFLLSPFLLHDLPIKHSFTRSMNYEAPHSAEAAFWDVTSCDSCKNRRFGGTYCFHNQGDKNRWARNDVSSDKQPTHAAKYYFPPKRRFLQEPHGVTFQKANST
jgi:hypothetical protein